MTHPIRLARLCTALVIALIPSITAAQTLTADQVIEKHLAAIGGRDALSKITSRRATGTVSVSSPVGDLSGPVEISAKAPAKTHVTIKLDLSAVGATEMVIHQMFDGTAGWVLNSMQGDMPMSADQLENSKNNQFPTPLLHYKENGATATIEGTQKINDRDAYVITLKPKTGPATMMFFDKETFMLVRSSSHFTNPTMGEVDQVTEASDYRDVNGIKVAFVIAQSAGGQDLRMVFSKVEHNVDLPDAYFVKK